LKNLLQHIRQFELSPLAKAGVFIRKMQNRAGEGEHDISTPHRDTHYLLMMATQGRFKLKLDFEELVIPAPAMLFVFPGQVHHILEMHEPQGWAISFDPALIDSEFQLVMENGFRGPLLLDTQAALYQQAVILMDLIEKLQSGIPDSYTGRSTQSLLAALLSLMAGQLVSSVSDSKTRASRGAIIEQAFGQLLKQHYKTWKQPAQYAAELSISVAHLNDTVKEITGNTVSTHIQQHAILEAKRLLYFTDLSVKEIGYELGYDEPVYFNKLFKKVTELTPMQFRQQFRD
jgi:AraC family transcriptional activator of pobA